MKQIIPIVLFILLIGALIFFDFRYPPCKNSIHNGQWKDYQTTDYQRGNMTYLIFHGNSSIYVVNYTMDSIEYELLHSPTKTQTSGTINCDSLYVNSETGEIR